MYHYVYKVKDLVTDEFYFGSRTCLCEPLNDNEYKGSMRKWQPRSYKELHKEIINDSFITREDAIEYESSLIKKYIADPLNRNYSVPGKHFHSVGGSGFKNHSHTTKSKLLIGLARKGKTYEEVFGIKKARELKNSHAARIAKSPTGFASPDYNRKGKESPMYNTSVLDIWIKKYGNDVANEMWIKKYAGMKGQATWNKNNKKVIQSDKEDNVVIYEGLHDVIEKNPTFSKSNICKALAGKRKSANGFFWEYQN